MTGQQKSLHREDSYMQFSYMPVLPVMSFEPWIAPHYTGLEPKRLGLNLLPQLVKVDGHLRPSVLIQPLRQAVREQLPNTFYIFIHDVRGLHIQALHRKTIFYRLLFLLRSICDVFNLIDYSIYIALYFIMKFRFFINIYHF